MQKKYFLMSSVGFVFILAPVILLSSFNLGGRKDQGSLSVCFRENCFFVELARTVAERARGLMFREELSEDRGMLFVFKGEGIHSFWMKNTYISLDIIWLNRGKEVVFISKNTPPCERECSSIIPNKSAKYVLEVNAGIAEKINLEIGDKLDFELK